MMNNDDKKAVYEEAIAFFGDESQKIMAIEEMSELTKELTKELRNRGNVENIADELADVEIMLAQLKKIYDIHETVERHKEFKLNRLHNSILELKSKK